MCFPRDCEQNFPINATSGIALSINVFVQNVRFLANFITEAGIIVQRSKVNFKALLGRRLGKDDEGVWRKNKGWKLKN